MAGTVLCCQVLAARIATKVTQQELHQCHSTRLATSAKNSPAQSGILGLLVCKTQLGSQSRHLFPHNDNYTASTLDGAYSLPIAQGQRKFAHGDEMVSTTIMHRIPTLEVAVTPRCADAAIRPNNTVAWGFGARTVIISHC